MEMGQELPVRNGTQAVRSRGLGRPAGPVADPALLPGNSPGPNHPSRAHLLDQLANWVSCMCLWCPLVDTSGISLARFPRDTLEVSAPEIQCTTIEPNPKSLAAPFCLSPLLSEGFGQVTQL